MNMLFTSSPLRALAAALISAGLTGPALADKAITPDMLKDMPLPQVKAYVAKKIQEQAQRRAQSRNDRRRRDATGTDQVLDEPQGYAAGGLHDRQRRHVSDDMSGVKRVLCLWLQSEWCSLPS